MSQKDELEKLSIKVGNWLEASASGRIPVILIAMITLMVVAGYIGLL